MQSHDVPRMPTSPDLLQEAVSNGVLAKLLPETLQAVRGNAARVRLVHGQIIAERDQPLHSVYFLVSGLVCLVQRARPDHGRQEGQDDGPLGMPQLAMVGRDGGMGVMELLIGCRSSLACAVVQVGGIAWRIDCEPLREIIQSSPDLQAAAQQSTRELVGQLMSVSTSHATGTVLQRCVRWLCMAQDRLGGSDVLVTHDGLAGLLGVRRSGVTVAMSQLQDRELIRTGRGRIKILDRVELKRLGGGGWPIDFAADVPVPAPLPRGVSYPTRPS